ncbi:MAG: hypothetical protein Q9227_005767 [Pyrenula ochraceoflavens]
MAPPPVQQFSHPVSQTCHLVLSHPLVSLSAIIVLWLLHNKFRRGLYSIPGPTIAAWTSLWRAWDVYRGHAHLNAIKLHRKHGKLVRTAPHVVSIGDRAEIANIYGRGEAFTKTAFYPIQSITWKKKIALNIFSDRDPASHRQEKRKVANAFSMSSVLQSEDEIGQCGQLLVQKLQDDFASKGKPVDLGAWLQYYAFDVIGEVTFATKLGFLEQGKDVEGMMKSIEGMLTYAAVIGQLPWLHPLLGGNPLFRLLMPAMETWNQNLVFTLKCINNRASIKRDGDLLNADVGGKDMLSRWAYVKSSDPLKMDTRSIVIHTSVNVFAGSDTTAIALRSICYYLMKNKHEMDKVVSEIDAADKDGKLSPIITYKESTDHLPYVGAAIKEGMRLHSSVGLIMERHVPREGAVICGKHIPGGTIVGINPWVSIPFALSRHLTLANLPMQVLNYDETLFPSPESFDPSRWLTASEEHLREMDTAWQLIFGGGSRVCIGRNISTIEIYKVIPQLLKTFTLELEKPEQEWHVRDHWFTQQEGLICRLTKR